jgi:flavin reductase (DIM6/NTAB) family NADH-FMN oxidoreductase RutF
MSNFKEINIKELNINPFEIKTKWMLVTGGNELGVNTMTASWGGFGVMWQKEVAFVVIRPQRYTKEFVDANESFSLCFFDKGYKKQLSYLGEVSGRDEDKISNSGLTVAYNNGVPYFEEAERVLIVKKLYAQPMGEEFFINEKISGQWFPQKDFHTLYVAEITKVLIKE